MPPKKSRGRRIVKRYKKRTYSRRLPARNSLIKLIKRVSLKHSETKNTHSISENLQLNHNVPYIITNQLYLEQGIGDNNTGTANFQCRIGDEVIPRGIQYKFWFANKLDRPNVMYKIIFFRYQSLQPLPLPSVAPYFSQGTTNYMIRDVDTERYKILKVVRFNLENSAQKIITLTDEFKGAEGHRSLVVWLPLKPRKLKYENGGTTPHFSDIGFTVVAYDSFGTLQTDTIASFAVNRKFYFKDP